jgi:CubicO group peptidase (beta-lactamase class C family)
MMRTILVSALVITSLSAGPAAQTVAVRPDAAGDEVFSKWSSSTPGCAVGVAVGGKPLLLKAYGMADLEHDVRNTPDTIFEAGSVSKQFVAAAVITLAERGRLSLDDDVRKWFPEVHDYGTPITIRHLLQHTSGLRDWGAVVELEGWPRGTRTIDHRHVLAIIARQRELNHPVGARYSYTNSGYSLLTMLVERVSGATLGDAPVTAAKSFFGNIGAAGGAVELAVSLLGLQRGLVASTLNYETPDPKCPVNVVAELSPATAPTVLKLSHRTTGQAVSLLVTME